MMTPVLACGNGLSIADEALTLIAPGIVVSHLRCALFHQSLCPAFATLRQPAHGVPVGRVRHQPNVDHLLANRCLLFPGATCTIRLRVLCGSCFSVQRSPNADHEPGPRTAAGKARSSQNALKHGLTSEKICLEFIEDPAELEAHRNSIFALYNPQNPMEVHWVDQIVIAQWRVQVLARWESGIFNDAIKKTWEENTDQEEEDAENLEQFVTNVEPGEKHSIENWMISYGMGELVRRKDFLKNFLRYQSQADRLIRRADDAIRKLRNEPVFSGQPSQEQSTSASENEPVNG